VRGFFLWSAALVLALSACSSRNREGQGAPDAGAPFRFDEPPWPGMTIDLSPDPGAEAVTVDVRVSGEQAGRITELAVARTWADTHGAEAVVDLAVRDGQGDLPVLPRQAPGDDLVLALGRAPTGGELLLHYRAKAANGGSRFGLRLGPDRLSAVGHGFLVLPQTSNPLPARVRFHLNAMAPGTAAASSFGPGEEVITTATPEELAHAVYLAGPRRLEEPLAPVTADADDPAQAALRPADPNQGKWLSVFGKPAFDTRAAFYWSAAAMAAAERFFRPVPPPGAPPPPLPQPSPFAFLLVAEPGMGRNHDAAYLTRSLGLWFDDERAFDAGLKSVVTHEIVHRWIGGALRLVDEHGREALWFSEGFTVHMARRLLLASRLVTPGDVLEDLRRTTEAPSARPGGPEDPACAEQQGGRSREEYRRGALYAAYLDAKIQRSSHGARSLDDLLRELLVRAESEGRQAYLPDVFREMVARELGPKGAEDFDRIIVGKGAVDLPKDAFGPCFQPIVREQRVFELGFDRASLAASPKMIRGVSRGSAAERVGLRNGMLVLSAKLPATSELPDSEAALPEVELLVATKRGGMRVRYYPVGIKRIASWGLKACKVPR